MTMPRERRNAITYAREFLRSLLDPKQTPRVPKAVRREAYYRLKHYPSDFDMERAAKDFEDVFGKPEKPTK